MSKPSFSFKQTQLFNYQLGSKKLYLFLEVSFFFFHVIMDNQNDIIREISKFLLCDLLAVIYFFDIVCLYKSDFYKNVALILRQTSV